MTVSGHLALLLTTYHEKPFQVNGCLVTGMRSISAVPNDRQKSPFIAISGHNK